MMSIQVTVTDRTDAILRAAERGTAEAVARTAYQIRQTAVNSIGESPEPSTPGTPPHTRGNNRLPRSIAYAADKTSAAIGPRASVIGEVGEAHEKGLTFRGIDYDPRPFMGPALDHNISAFGDNFAGRIGE